MLSLTQRQRYAGLMNQVVARHLQVRRTKGDAYADREDTPEFYQYEHDILEARRLMDRAVIPLTKRNLSHFASPQVVRGGPPAAPYVAVFDVVIPAGLTSPAGPLTLAAQELLNHYLIIQRNADKRNHLNSGAISQLHDEWNSLNRQYDSLAKRNQLYINSNIHAPQLTGDVTITNTGTVPVDSLPGMLTATAIPDTSIAQPITQLPAVSIPPRALTPQEQVLKDQYLALEARYNALTVQYDGAAFIPADQNASLRAERDALTAQVAGLQQLTPAERQLLVDHASSTPASSSGLGSLLPIIMIASAFAKTGSGNRFSTQVRSVNGFGQWGGIIGSLIQMGTQLGVAAISAAMTDTDGGNSGGSGGSPTYVPVYQPTAAVATTDYTPYIIGGVGLIAVILLMRK